MLPNGEGFVGLRPVSTGSEMQGSQPAWVITAGQSTFPEEQ